MLVMVAITAVFIFVVAALHVATRERVSRNASLFLRRAVMEAAGAGAPGDAEQVLSWYDEKVRPLPAGSGPAASFRVSRESSAAGVLVRVRKGVGLWGEITAVTGVDEGTGTITGIAFLDHNETPGLGARISEDWFKGQFKGKRGPFTLVPEGTRSPSPTEMDAITGATITSRGVRDILNALVGEQSGTMGSL